MTNKKSIDNSFKYYIHVTDELTFMQIRKGKDIHLHWRGCGLSEPLQKPANLRQGVRGHVQRP